MSRVPVYYYYNDYISDFEDVVKEYMANVYQMSKSQLEDELGTIYDFEELMIWCEDNGVGLEELRYDIDLKRIFENEDL